MKSSLSFLKAATVAMCAGVSVFVTGCAGISGIGNGAGGTTSATGAVSTFSGRTYGGFNPISGAAIDLYAAGTSYGTATHVAATTSGSDGKFQLSYDASGATNEGTDTSYNCSSNGVSASTQMYLTSTGGNTANSGGTSGNTAAVLMVALGPCSGLETTTNVTINEATTVAMVYAMQQFISMSSGVQVGAPAPPALTTTGGLALAYQTATLLVDPGTGTVNTSSTPSGSVSNVTMTVTPESAKITSLANLLSNCVNQTDAGATVCTSLFGEIKSPSIQMTPVSGVPTSAAPTDIAMAAWYLAMNPAQLQNTANVASLYTASTGYEPFGVGGLSAAPTDWTVDVVYSAGTSTCGYTVSSGSGTTQPFGSPSQMAIDANGNVWVSNTRGYVSGSLGVPAYVEVSNTGALSACVATYTNTSGNATTYYNGYEYYVDPQEYWYPSIVVDIKNNVWYSSETGGVFELPNGTTTPVQATATGNTFYASQLLPLANGDIIANSVYSTSPTTFDYVNAANNPSVTPTSFPFTARSAGFAAIYPNGSTTSTTPNILSMGTLDVYQMLASGADTWSSSTLTATSATAVYSSSGQTKNCNVMVTGIAPDYLGNAVGTSCAGPSGGSGSFSSWYLMTPGSSTPTLTTSSTTYLGGLNGGSRPAVDSLHHVWAGTQLPVATVSGNDVYAFASMYWNGTSTTSATNLSPSGSEPSGGCSYTACLSGGGFQHSNITGPIVDTAIDQAGNVWGLMGDDTTSNFATKGLVEVVGAAAPVVTPLVNGLIQ